MTELDDLRDHILQSFGVPASVLAGEGTYADGSLAKAFQARVEEETAILADVLDNAVRRFAHMELVLRPLARKRCWWHCKKWQRRKSGRRPLVRA